MNNIVKPIPCRILDVKRESQHEYTFKVETDIRPSHGQFLQLSIPKIGEAPISVSSFGDGWLDFTIRSVGKVTEEIFRRCPGEILFLRGAYGKGWPMEQFQGKHMVIITGGTGLAPVKSMLNLFYDNPGYVKSVTLISGFKNEEGIIFKNDLERWKESFTTIYTLDRDRKDGWETGFVTEFVSRVPFEDFGQDYEVVIVGPPPMMKFTSLKVLEQNTSGQKVPGQNALEQNASGQNALGQNALGQNALEQNAPGQKVPEERLWLSFERRMSCAVGKCGHCRIDEVYVCLDGPVFPYTQAKYLVD